MVALYDYNPEVQSPQDNPDSELPFKKGQMLTVVGEMVSGQMIVINDTRTAYVLIDVSLCSFAVYFNELCCCGLVYLDKPEGRVKISNITKKI